MEVGIHEHGGGDQQAAAQGVHDRTLLPCAAACSASSPSAIRSPTAAASCNGASRCSRGRCGRRARWAFRTRPTRATAPPSRPCSTSSSPPSSARRRARGRYDLGCLYIGTNDVRGFDWDPFAYERDLREALGFLGARCERTLTATIPLDLGRPRAGAKVRTRTRSSSAARARPARSSSTSAASAAAGADGRPRPPDRVRPDRDRRARARRARARRPGGAHAPRELIVPRDHALAAPARRRHLPLPPRQGQRRGGGEPAQAAARPPEQTPRPSELTAGCRTS